MSSSGFVPAGQASEGLRRRCRKGKHRWGLWIGGEWHGLPHWVAGAPRVTCRYCPARGLLDTNGVHQTSGVGAPRSRFFAEKYGAGPGA